MDRLLVIRGGREWDRRLQGVLGGIGLCLLTGRALCVDWRDGGDPAAPDDVFSRLFTIPGLGTLPTPPPVLPETTIQPAWWRGHLADPTAVPPPEAGRGLDVALPDDGPDILVGWDVDLEAALALAPPLARNVPGFSGRKPLEVCRDLLRGYLRPAPELSRAVASFAASRFAAAGMVGAVVRNAAGGAALEAVARTAREIMDRTGHGLFVATDDSVAPEDVCRLFPKGVHVGLAHPSPAAAPRGGGPDRAVPDAAGLVEIFLLGRCRFLVHHAPGAPVRIPPLLSGLPPDRITAVA